MIESSLPNFQKLDAVDGTIYGGHNKVSSVNPFNTRFIADYGNQIIHGTNLFTTGWDDIPHGIKKLTYVLSTGHVITIPKYIAYKPLVEVSLGMDGSRIFHFINVNCLGNKEVIIYKIVLRQDNISKYKIGDIVLSKSSLPATIDSGWKYTS